VKYHKQFQIVEPDLLSGIHETRVLPGRGMLIPFQALRAPNYFDEQFVQYASDSDFCYRAQKNGYGIYVSWDAKIFGYINETDKCSSFVTSTFPDFIRSFVNKYSRNYLKSTARLLYRHGLKLLLPVTLGIVIIATIKAHFINTKLYNNVSPNQLS
jgi:GT2 family glycosyltransferase